MRQLTFAPHGHILTNTGVWSANGTWIVYDVRADPAGSVFNGDRIEAVNVETGEVQVLYRSQEGACCGVASWHPCESKIVFILGPERPTPDFAYAASRRRGVIVDQRNPNLLSPLDARDLTPPFTPGALRGGTHLHVFSPNGHRVSFTYEDDLLQDQRNVGVCFPRDVQVSKSHPRNHDGDYFSVLVTQTTATPLAGSDEISRAYEEAWLGNNAIAFQGDVLSSDGKKIPEAFIVELPDDLTCVDEGPLQGTTDHRPFPPAGVKQRRLTFTNHRKFPGIQGTRHWLRSSPDGSSIATLMKDDAGVVQIWLTSPAGELRQLTHNSSPIASAFTWSPSGKSIAHVMDECVCVTEVASGNTRSLTKKSSPRPEACVFSPDGEKIAFVCPVEADGRTFNQIFVTHFV